MAKKKIQKDEYKEKLPRGYEDTFSMSERDLESLSIQIKADLLQAEEEKQTWIEERIKDVRAYFGIKKQTDWPFKGAAKISSQMHRVMVDTMAANLVSSANAPENILTVKTQKSQSIENAKYVEDLHNSLARMEYHFPDVMDRAIHNALIESFVVLKPCYELDVCETVQTVKRWIPSSYNPEDIHYDSYTDTVTDANGAVIPSLDAERLPEDSEELKSLDLKECVIEVTREDVKEGLKLYSIPGSDVFINVSAPGETPYEKYQRAPYVIQQEYKTVQEMKEMQNYGRIKNFEILTSNLNDNLAADQLRDEKEEQSGYFDLDNERRRLVRNIWWYGKYEYKGRLRELVVYMNYETGTILKVQVNQFGIRPFFPLVPFPVDGTPFGESLPKKIRPLVSELELAMNTVINMGLIKAYPPKFFDPNSGFDPKTLGNIGPNAYIPVRDPSRNVFLPPQPEDPRILMDMVRLIMDLIERTTANSDAVQGQVSPTANTTAFEVQQSLVRAGVRFDIIYKRLKEQMSPMFKYIDKLVGRFMPLDKEKQMMGEMAVLKAEDGSETSRFLAIRNMEGEHGLVLTGDSVIEEQANAQKAEKLFMLMGQDPYVSYKPESPYYLRFNLIKHYNPIMMDKLLPKPEEVAQLLRDRAQVQSEQEQKAVDDASQQRNPQAEMAQAELQLKMQQAQIDAEVKMRELQIKQMEAEQKLKQNEEIHQQKMRQMEEEGRLKLQLMKEQSDAKAKAKPSNNS